ncbi:hypothetical protein BGP_4928 [Beggiatoa sp. PS]|nr:hypothetical protein BGP_4928 [Beggiatoa sp. PS]
MKYFSGLIFLAIMAYLVWPYYHLYEINSAVAQNNKAALEQLVDFKEVNEVYKEDIKWRSEHTVASQGEVLPDAMREGAQALMGTLGGIRAETSNIDTNWIIDRLRNLDGSPLSQLNFAFFESPTRFMIRIGKLGRNPIHIQMTMQDWYWRITAVYI